MKASYREEEDTSPSAPPLPGYEPAHHHQHPPSGQTVDHSYQNHSHYDPQRPTQSQPYPSSTYVITTHNQTVPASHAPPQYHRESHVQPTGFWHPPVGPSSRQPSRRRRRRRASRIRPSTWKAFDMIGLFLQTTSLIADVWAWATGSGDIDDHHVFHVFEFGFRAVLSFVGLSSVSGTLGPRRFKLALWYYRLIVLFVVVFKIGVPLFNKMSDDWDGGMNYFYKIWEGRSSMGAALSLLFFVLGTWGPCVCCAYGYLKSVGEELHDTRELLDDAARGRVGEVEMTSIRR